MMFSPTHVVCGYSYVCVALTLLIAFIHIPTFPKPTLESLVQDYSFFISSNEASQPGHVLYELLYLYFYLSMDQFYGLMATSSILIFPIILKIGPENLIKKRNWNTRDRRTIAIWFVNVSRGVKDEIEKKIRKIERISSRKNREENRKKLIIC